MSLFFFAEKRQTLPKILKKTVQKVKMYVFFLDFRNKVPNRTLDNMVIIHKEVKYNRNEVQDEVWEKFMFKRVKKFGGLDIIIQKSYRFLNNVKNLLLLNHKVIQTESTVAQS